jgi:AcrR family transcriptional regulator
LADRRDPGGRPAQRTQAEPARRIVRAARQLIGQRGVADARITDIAHTAGVARGAIFYYFGTKERLVVEVLRADADERLTALRREVAPASSPDELVSRLAGQLVSFLNAERASRVLMHQIDSAGITPHGIRVVQQQIRVGWREALAGILREKERAGVVRLRGEPDVVAVLLTSLGHGIANELLTDGEWNPQPAIALGEQLARWLLTADPTPTAS